jgi:hypothetical protein
LYYREHFVCDSDQSVAGGGDQISAVPPGPANHRASHALAKKKKRNTTHRRHGFVRRVGG